MSYTTIYRCANDPEFQARIMACAAQEGEANPDFALTYLRWPVSSKAHIEEAYEYAVDSDNPSPGGDPSVITDQQILLAVQSLINQPPQE